MRPASRSRLPRAVVLFSISAFAAAAPGCRCDKGGSKVDPVEQSGAFGAMTGAQPGDDDLARLLVRARAVVDGKDASSLPKSTGANRRVFLTAYAAPLPPRSTTALAANLDDAITAAAKDISSNGQMDASHPVRLAIDVVTQVAPIALAAPIKPAVSDIALDGYAAEKAGKFAAVLPSEILERKLYATGKTTQIKEADVTSRLRDRLGGQPTEGSDPTKDWTSFSFRTDRRIESSVAGAPPLRIFRDMQERAPAVTPALLIDAVRSGADYLTRVLNSDGHFVYNYRALDDHDDSSYGLLRHAGATYAILEAYDELRTPMYLEKANKALDYLKQRFKVPQKATEPLLYLSDNAEEEQQKVGGNGLALLAYCKRAETTKTQADLDVMRQLGLEIARQQYEDGHFRDNDDVMKEDATAPRTLKKEVIYFTGEAILGLLRLYAVDPDPRWLSAAKKGADYAINVRDAGKTTQNIEHDHWLSYALNELYRQVPNQAYVDHALLIGQAIVDGARTKTTAPAPDFIGSYFPEAPSTPAAVRLEAMDADMRLLRFTGKPLDPFQPTATEVGRFLVSQQFTLDNDFFLKNPQKARGGVRESLLNQDIRIDYVQHAMSGWLHLARLLRDPTYGTAK